MIYKKDSEKKTRGKGANGTQGRAGMGKEGPPCGRMMAGAGGGRQGIFELKGPDRGVRRTQGKAGAFMKSFF